MSGEPTSTTPIKSILDEVDDYMNDMDRLRRESKDIDRELDEVDKLLSTIQEDENINILINTDETLNTSDYNTEQQLTETNENDFQFPLEIEDIGEWITMQQKKVVELAKKSHANLKNYNDERKKILKKYKQEIDNALKNNNKQKKNELNGYNKNTNDSDESGHNEKKSGFEN
eukprot:367220_1